MKKLLLIATTILFMSCHEEPKDFPFTKPFLIIRKSDQEKGYAWYVYQDSLGNQQGFIELENKYNIGDEIK